MKDEEMADKHAEEYIMRDDVVTENDRVPFDNGYGYQTISFENEVKEGFKDGFLAGLREGRPQWHDLRKDPNDLPKKKQECLCKVNYYDSDEVFNGCLTYSPKLKGFYLDSDEETEEALFKITAWCEIPTFDKE